MAQADIRSDGPPKVEVRTVQRSLSWAAIVIIFTVSGEPYGLEDVVGGSGPGKAVLLIVPISLMCAELATAMPTQGGYYVWSGKKLFHPKS